MTSDAAPALALRGIAKRFGRVAALDGATLIVRAGTVHALLGENGAGKTTLMRIAFGLERADAGVVERNGRPVKYRHAHDAIADAVGMVHQHFSLVPAMTAAENVALGGRDRYDLATTVARMRTIGESTGMVIDPNAVVAQLSVGMQQRVEIVKAFAHDATLLILDEPTAVLAPRDAQDLLARLRAFANEGNAVVFITHKLRDALDVADELTVLRRGTTVLTARAGDASEASLVDAMVGAQPPGEPRASEPTIGNAVLRAERVSAVDWQGTIRLRDATLSVHAGEIVGVAGVEGNGQRELLRVLAGRLRPAAGTIDRPANVGFVPEDRHRDALVLSFNLAENIAVAGAHARRGVIHWPAVVDDTRALMEEYDVRASGPLASPRSLSGGNQQRLVLGREFRASPRAIVAENPTRGLDVRAADAVHRHLRSARGRGAAIVLYMNDLDELLQLADRVVVCFGGTVREVSRNVTEIGRALVGINA